MQQLTTGSVIHLYHLGDALGFGNVRGTVIVYEGTPVPPEPPEPPEPEPDPPDGDYTIKDNFPWVLYARKFRDKRGGRHG